MRKTLLSCALLSLIFSLSSQATIFSDIASGGGLPGIDQANYGQTQEGEDSQGTEGPFRGAQNRSSRIKNCEILVRKRWGDISTQYYNQSEIYSYAIPETLKALKANAEDTTNSGTDNQGAQPAGAADPQLKKAMANLVYLLTLCQAYKVSTDPSNYNENYNKFEGDGRDAAKSNFGGSGLECANQPTQQAQQACMAKAQEEGGMGCSHEGPETHDYLQCRKIVQFMDGFVIGKQVMQVQQTFRAGSKQMELQDEITQKSRTQEGVDITDGMNVQAQSTRQQGNLAYEMAAFDGAKAGTLLAMINSFPTPESMIESCQEQMASSTKDVILGAFKGQAADTHRTHPDIIDTSLINAINELQSSDIPGGDFELICAQAISTNRNAGGGENFFFLNQEVRDKMKAVAMKAGLEALANGAKGALLHDQAGQIEDAMKDIEEFEPPEFPVAEELPQTASECLINPDAEGCIAPTSEAYNGFRDQGFNANFGGGANLGTPTLEGSLNDDTSVTGATNRNLIPDSFGTVDSLNNSENGFVDGQARAGSIKTGQIAGGGGGGVGGSAGGGGFGGGGGANRPGQKEKPSGKKDVFVKTKGSGLTAVGGRGTIGASKKKPANPFSKLLGKNKKKGNSTLNFRGPAQVAGKKGSLFQMISNRYSRISQKDRLLKYEVKN